jgi:hypothetical protein
MGMCADRNNIFPIKTVAFWGVIYYNFVDSSNPTKLNSVTFRKYLCIQVT